MSYQEGMVSIRVTEYKALLLDSELLNALYAGGVDNWEGYDAAVEGLDEDE